MKSDNRDERFLFDFNTHLDFVERNEQILKQNVNASGKIEPSQDSTSAKTESIPSKEISAVNAEAVTDPVKQPRKKRGGKSSVSKAPADESADDSKTSLGHSNFPMTKVKLVSGDFLKNAGIVGFLKLLSHLKNSDGISLDMNDSQEYPEEIDVAELTDPRTLAESVIDVFIEKFRDKTYVKRTSDNLFRRAESFPTLEECSKPEVLEKLNKDIETINKGLKKDYLKMGFDSLKSTNPNPESAADYEFYEHFKDDDGDIDFVDVEKNNLEKVKTQVQSLAKFIKREEVQRVFLFKDIAYNVISKFWGNIDNKARARSSIFYSTKACMPIDDAVQSDITEPLFRFLSFLPEKAKAPSDSCISCSLPIPSDKRPISCWADVMDGMDKKSSTFWNCRPDAYLCPFCSFLYLLSPLGFTQVDYKTFVFINSNGSLEELLDNNNDIKGDYIDHVLLKLLDSKQKLLSNVQVITRTFREDDSKKSVYRISIIDKNMLKMIHKTKFDKGYRGSICDALRSLSRIKPINLTSKNGAKATTLDIYRRCFDNVLNYSDQYNLINTLVLLNDGKVGIDNSLYFIMAIQRIQLCYRYELRGELEMKENLIRWQLSAEKAGEEIRKVLLGAAVGGDNVGNLGSEQKEEIVRSVVYQLVNALKTNNKNQFIDLVIRIYTSNRLPIPSVFMQSLCEEDAFSLIGYSFLLGIKRGHYVPKQDSSVEESTEKEQD